MRVRILNLKFIIAFAMFYGYTYLKRGFVYVFSYLAEPLALMFLLYMINHRYLPYGVLGGLVTMIMGISINSIGDYVYLRNEIKLQDLLVASQVGPTDYILGLTFANLIFSSPGIFGYIVLNLALRVVNIVSLVFIILLSLLLLFTGSFLAFMIASFIPQTRYSWGVATILFIALTILPPVYYPYTLLPTNVIYALSIIPTTPTSIIAQGLAGLQELNIKYLIPLLVEFIVFYLISVKVSRWRSK